VEIDLKAIGFTAAKVATKKLSGDSEYTQKNNVIIPSELLLRDTVAKITH
jgi:DNA-binding LacI/PurR family transcriptional regulator